MRELRAIALVFVMISFALPARAAITFLDGELEATAENSFSGVPPNGYAPLWVDLHSRAARRRDFVLKVRGYATDLTATRAVSLDPGEARTVFVPVPASLRAGELTILEDGRPLAGQLSLNVREGNDAARLVIGADAAYRTAFGPSVYAQFLDAGHAPDLLAAYAGYAAVIVLEPIPNAAARSALEAYARAGGTVLFASDAADAPALARWRADGSMDDDEPLGLGRVGSCHEASACMGRLTRPPHALRTINESSSALMQFTSSPGTLLPDVGRTPVGAFLVIILLFAVAIGPVNFAFASRYGRHLLLLTIPALAATTCAGIATYGVAADGLFTLHAQTRSVAMLDPDAHEVAVAAVTGRYAALAPAHANFPAGTALLLPSGPTTSVGFDWSSGETMTGAFLPSRSYRESALVTVQPSRARVTIANEELDNALGGRITHGFLVRGGRRYAFDEIADGKAGILTDAPGSGGQDVLASGLGDRFTKPLLEQLTRPLAEGEFLATVEDAPFVPDGGMRATDGHVFTLVRGRISP